MRIARITVAACATLLCAGTAPAKFTPTPQQKCDAARITAWKVYTSCVDAVVAKDAKGVPFDEFAAFAKCRHTYFKKWAGLQAARFSGSTCAVGLTDRFVDNGDGTVTDNLSTLVWEKKTNDASAHDVGNTYTWSTGSPYAEDGTAFASFLTDPTTGLNVIGFAGANGWRLPTLGELQTILLDFKCTGAGGSATCSCSSNPCIDGTFDAANTQSDYYWSATSDVANPNRTWDVPFSTSAVHNLNKTLTDYVRAVRGGL